MAIVDEVAFRRMDTRLAALLLERSRLQNPVHITHQEIAAELGSSREVISRLLEDFTSQGLIRFSGGWSKSWMINLSKPRRLCDIVTDEIPNISYTGGKI